MKTLRKSKLLFLYYCIAAIAWLQAVLLALSGFIKPERGRWWQGMAFSIFFGVIAATFFQLARRKAAHMRRPTSFFCLKCGQELRATADRCPECGSVVTTKGTMPVR